MDGFTRESYGARVVFGPGAARTELAREVAALRVSNVLLLTTKRAEPLARELTADLPVVDVFTGVREHVPAEVARDALDAATRGHADCLLSVGGGSSVGTAKAVALSMRVPIVAVPTTYAGSEMTPVWGRTEDGVKRTGRSPDVVARLVVYDPELTAGLPPEITAASGMNALAHAVRALAADPVTALVGSEAVRVLTAALPRAVAEEDRVDALYGAYLAASAFAVAGSGPHHKLCHALGGTYGLPHAPTHAVLLPYTAAGTVDGLRELAGRIGAPTSLRAIGMGDADLADAVERLPESARILVAAYEGKWPA
ncbi:MAG TPA: iron-containing alcohol dehydrogenase [Actinophytocola sp.]|jgi:maleylacetate reductase|nr:iron-containing alcohol dehydrogenase [Actinophytocola sp.]